jgi:hypothetical protein
VIEAIDLPRDNTPSQLVHFDRPECAASMRGV